MTDLEAIEIRKSRRGYLDTPIKPKSMEKLKSILEDCNQKSGLSLQWIEDGREAFSGFSIGYGMFSGVRSYFALVGKNSDAYRNEKIGYYGEILVLEATKLGLGTCWVGGTFRKSHCPCVIGPDETLVGVITVGNVAEKEGLKERTIYRLAHRGTKTLEQLYTSDQPVPDWFISGMQSVQKAPSAVNRQPVHFLNQNGVITAAVHNASQLQLIDLGIAKLHFELGAGKGKFELGNEAKWLA